MDYITKDKIKEIASGYKLYIFGAGLSTEYMLGNIPEGVKIEGIIDNYKQGSVIFGKTIITLNHFLRNKPPKSIVIVVTYWYKSSMCKLLDEAGMVLGEDYFIWDDEYRYHTCKIIDNFIDYQNKLWAKMPIVSKNSKILAPFEVRHESNIIIESYLARYFSEKYDAEVWGYILFGGLYSDASEVFKKIYNSSCGMKDVVDYSLSVEMKKESNDLFDKIWNNTYSWSDIQKITIFGIHFGTTIIRYIVRMFGGDFDVKSESMKKNIKRCIQYIVFWYRYFQQNTVKVVILADGVGWDSFIRDIAISNGIDVYCLQWSRRLELDFCPYKPSQYFGKFWEELSKEEQEYGIKWAKEHIESRLEGNMEDIPAWMNELTYAKNNEHHDILDKNDKLKVLICTHIFEEDSYCFGPQLFDDSYVSWLDHLGQLSLVTSDYDWYIKEHPDSERLDKTMMDKFLRKYPNIKRLGKNVSARQLKEEGVKYAFTVFGSIGHEYPALGIQVINAGYNPGSAFSFNINPNTKEEFDEIVLNLRSGKYDIESLDDLYKFYCIQYLYYNWDYYPLSQLFFDNEELRMNRFELAKRGKQLSVWIYDAFIDEWNVDKHNSILKQMPEIVERIDSWRPYVFYRKHTKI